jgi:3-phosphoshikimate 1-carboxyvinyltransferase
VSSHFSAQVERLDGLQHMRIPAGQQYRSPGSAFVEGDASSASYFLAGATITGNRLAL